MTALRQKRYVFNGITERMNSAPETIAETDSNAFVPPVVSPQGYRDHQKNVSPTNGTLTFDHRKFFYYIQVNMRRPGGTTGPLARGVHSRCFRRGCRLARAALWKSWRVMADGIIGRVPAGHCCNASMYLPRDCSNSSKHFSTSRI